MKRINRRFLFEFVRQQLFDGKLNQRQVNGLNTLFDYWESKYRTKDDRWLAYILGTAHHEVDRKMQPIKERGGAAYFKRMLYPSWVQDHSRYEMYPVQDNDKTALSRHQSTTGESLAQGFL